MLDNYDCCFKSW